MDILQALDDHFPDTSQVMRKDNPKFEQALAEINQFARVGLAFTYGISSNPEDGAAAEKTPEECQAEFEMELDKLDVPLQVKGPFRLGSEFAAIDAVMIPNMG
jgi:glutathione S-transferase